jgi:hypothetical protein
VTLGPKALWYWLHLGCQQAGVGAFIAGVTLALVVVPDDYSEWWPAPQVL